MADDEHRRQTGGIGLAGRALGIGQAAETGPCARPSRDHVSAPARRPPGKFRRVIVGVKRPFGVVVARHQAAPIDRHQFGQVLVDAWAVQALVEVLPENLPVAVHHLAKDMAADQLLQRPVGEIA